MTVNIFVDTNVLVYARDSSEPEKQPLAAEWLAHLWRSQTGRLSIQILNEYYVTVTQKLGPGMSKEEAREDVRNLMLWRPVPLSTTVVERAWRIQYQHGTSFWEALIVAAAQVARCSCLLSEDLQDGQDLDGVQVVDPFRHRHGTVPQT